MVDIARQGKTPRRRQSPDRIKSGKIILLGILLILMWFEDFPQKMLNSLVNEATVPMLAKKIRKYGRG